MTTGLCDTCRNARRVESAKGSVFLLCELAATDSHFPKYPRLPVLFCAGYRQTGEAERPDPGKPRDPG